MLIRALVIAVLALLLVLPVGDVFAEKKKSLSDLSAQDQLKLQEASNAFNRSAPSRPAAGQPQSSSQTMDRKNRGR